MKFLLFWGLIPTDRSVKAFVQHYVDFLDIHSRCFLFQMTPHVTFAINEMKNRKRMRPPSSYIPWAGALRILPSQFFVHLPLKNSTITRLRSLWWSFARIFSILGKFLSGKDYPFDERFYFSFAFFSSVEEMTPHNAKLWGGKIICLTSASGKFVWGNF